MIVLTPIRLSRSLRDLLEIFEIFNQCRADFVTVNERIDARSPSGKQVFQRFGVIAELIRNQVRERVREGIAAVRTKGQISGRLQSG